MYMVKKAYGLTDRQPADSLKISFTQKVDAFYIFLSFHPFVN